MMKTLRGLLVVAATVTLVGGMATTASAETLGWSEVDGNVASSSVEPGARAAQVNHRGTAEQKSINGTTNKRSHGWTTWSGVYHYTRAQLKSGSSINADSNRVYGRGGTEAVTAWKPFRVVGGDLVSPGTAYTFYGQ
ncbi:hypothetical protein C5B85_18315 [Pseudoclavibacter sp. AY1F1]|uniref:hypothetical protein n=1 Tax=Pseudoclavibacter sp. AY1F1 TaxID=2080583 RepID=UPI000CE7955F|nr:hypothetical protein [Pseudoclavibacter sp. AY1F1]PPF41876.1 hypothetical protein C5B85_18315 [Pseudoclavibacter sp. AY1F1]